MPKVLTVYLAAVAAVILSAPCLEAAAVAAADSIWGHYLAAVAAGNNRVSGSLPSNPETHLKIEISACLNKVLGQFGPFGSVFASVVTGPVQKQLQACTQQITCTQEALTGKQKIHFLF